MFFRLRELREENDLKQSDVGRVLHCAQQTYSSYEKRIREIPIESLVKLAEYYHTSVDYLLGLTDVREPYPPSTRKQFDE